MRAPFRTFARSEDGNFVGSVFWLMTTIMVTGLAVDVSHVNVARQTLKQAADLGAHAGVVAMHGGATDAEIRAAVLETVEENLQPGRFGDVLSEPATDVIIAHYDEATNQLRSAPTADTHEAVLVRVQRTAENGNPVGLLALRAMNFFPGARMLGWDVRADGASILAPSAHCNSEDAIYSGGEIDLTSQSTWGAGFCLHAVGGSSPSQQNAFETGAVFSMPDLAGCQSKCVDSANPGIEDAMARLRFPDPDIVGRIEATASELLNERGEIFEHQWEGVTLDANLSPLAILGSIGGYRLGDVVEIHGADFAALPHVPEGLTYHVRCGGFPRATGGMRRLNRLDLDMEIENAAVVTDCDLRITGELALRGAILAQYDPSATLQVENDAQIGANPDTCDPAARSSLLTYDDVRAPARFAASNLNILTAGGVHFSSGSSDPAPHHGLSIFAVGDVHISAQHVFRSCGGPAGPINPTLWVLRHVEPV